MLLTHRTVTCPYCWQSIDLALDLSVAEQHYVEDCSVCCRPMSIRCRSEHGELAELDVAAEGEA